jgi:hypothetical protein
MVLFAAVSAVLSFFIVSRLWPGKRHAVPIAGVTDDRFAVVLEEADSTFDPVEMGRLFQSLHAVHVEEQPVDEVSP